MKSLLLISAALATLCAPTAAVAQPVWTDIMNQPNQSSMASGTFWQFSNLPNNGDKMVPNTDILVYRNLSIPGLDAGTPATGGGHDSVCNRDVGTPTQYLESNLGSGIKGVGFEGTFSGQSIPGNHFGPGSSLFEAVFFNDTKCYNGGREYGFFYDPYGNGVWVYWGTNENQSTVVQAQLQMTNVFPNTEYFYEIYPTGNSTSCGFQVNVLKTDFTPVYTKWLDVNANNFPDAGYTITRRDPGFCGAVTASNGETGYVSANTVYAPTISSIPANINVNLQRVFVGK